MTSTTTSGTRPVNAFGRLLKEWRRARGVSQLDLSLDCGVSQRHVSFLESGRSSPSRAMVLHLADALGVPLRQQNAMLIAAGFAPVFHERPLDSPELQQIGWALDRTIEQQEPFPAIVVDRNYNLLRANRAARRMVAVLLGTDPENPPQTSAPANIAYLTLAPEGLKPRTRNWEAVALWFVRRLRAEAVRDGARSHTHELLAKLMALPDVERLARTPRDDADAPPILVVEFDAGGATLSLFTMIANLGTPLDTALQGLHVEFFFPADKETEAWFRNMADAPGDRK